MQIDPISRPLLPPTKAAIDSPSGGASFLGVFDAGNPTGTAEADVIEAASQDISAELARTGLDGADPAPEIREPLASEKAILPSGRLRVEARQALIGLDTSHPQITGEPAEQIGDSATHTARAPSTTAWRAASDPVSAGDLQGLTRKSTLTTGPVPSIQAALTNLAAVPPVHGQPGDEGLQPPTLTDGAAQTTHTSRPTSSHVAKSHWSHDVVLGDARIDESPARDTTHSAPDQKQAAGKWSAQWPDLLGAASRNSDNFVQVLSAAQDIAFAGLPENADMAAATNEERGLRGTEATVAMRPLSLTASQRFDPTVLAVLRDAALAAQGDGGRLIELDTGSDVLGKLSLSIQSQDGTLQVTLLSGRPDALELLRRAIGVFLRDLSEQGYSKVDVHLGSTGADATGIGNVQRVHHPESDASHSPFLLASREGGFDKRL